MIHGDLSEIYRARNMQEAALLKNRLEEEGIRATVMNGALEGGAGVDVLGWATQPRVMVADPDAERARKIALEYERRRAEIPPSHIPEPEGRTSDDGWPRCPSCGRRRLTACPHCGTAGAEFPEGDIDVGSLLELDQPTPGAAPCCGPAGCTPIAESSHSEQNEESPFTSDSPAILLCPTCDEPFTPQYLRRCEWCGHQFPDGVEIDPLPAQQAAVNQRIIFTVTILVLLVIALGTYLFWLF